MSGGLPAATRENTRLGVLAGASAYLIWGLVPVFFRRIAALLAAIGVAIEAARIGGLPWISLLLAGTFGIYGLLRKRLPLDAASGLFLETVCMTPWR